MFIVCVCVCVCVLLRTGSCRKIAFQIHTAYWFSKSDADCRNSRIS